MRLQLLTWISDIFIKEDLKRGRVTEVKNLQSAKTMLFLFNADSEKHQNTVLKWKEEVAKQYNFKIDALGFTFRKEKKRPAYMDSTGKRYVMLGPKKTTLFFKPKATHKFEGVRRLLQTEYDILIDFTQNEFYPLRRFLVLSRAKFRVGYNRSGSEPFYDMLIGGEGKEKIEDYKKQVFHYLEIINKNDAK